MPLERKIDESWPVISAVPVVSLFQKMSPEKKKKIQEKPEKK